MTPKRSTQIVQNIVPLVLAVAFLIPVVWMLFVSVKTEGMPIKGLLDWFLPPYSNESYINVMAKTKILQWMVNSLYVAVAHTALTLMFASLAAFAISVIHFQYKNFVYLFIIAGLLIPGEATIIPLYAVVKDLHMLDSFQGLIWPGVATPVAVIVLKSFFDGVPKEVIESAELDGCGSFRLYYQMIIPLAKPALASMGIFTFISSWNNFLWPYLAISSKELFTLPVGIPTLMSNYSVDFVMPMTVNAIASIPVIILFLFFQNQIVKGISFTGIKG